jgi:hypothetical protein
MSKIFISYSFKEPDSQIASRLTEGLKTEHEVFFASESIRLGDTWADEIDKALENCDYFLLLLSERSMHSEMVTEEVRRAKKLRETRDGNKPVIFPVRINLPFEQDINYDLAGYLNRIQQRLWKHDADTEDILEEIRKIIHEKQDTYIEHSIVIPKLVDTLVPLPNAPLELEIPEGKMRLQSEFYVEREGEKAFISQIAKPGSLLRIKAPRQFGKTSLLSRVLEFAIQRKFQVVSLSFQQFDEGDFSELNRLTRQICVFATKALKLPLKIDDYWKNDFMGIKMKCSSYFEDYLMKEVNGDVVFAIDEADRLFKYNEVSTDFFSMLRAWHENALESQFLDKMHMVITHSVEVNLCMEDINQSPFCNVGTVMTLKEFTEGQVEALVRKHGLQWDKDQVVKLMDIIGGYPFLVRKSLYEIASNNISFDELINRASSDDGPFGDHLRRHYAVLTRKPELLQEFRFILNNGRANDLLSYYRLMAGGLVKGDSRNAIPSFKLYQIYFDKRL